jgi:hypothetical protein
MFKAVRVKITKWKLLHNKNFIHKFYDFLAVNFHTVIFCVMTSCSLVGGYPHL